MFIGNGKDYKATTSTQPSISKKQTKSASQQDLFDADDASSSEDSDTEKDKEGSDSQDPDTSDQYEDEHADNSAEIGKTPNRDTDDKSENKGVQIIKRNSASRSFSEDSLSSKIESNERPDKQVINIYFTTRKQ